MTVRRADGQSPIVSPPTSNTSKAPATPARGTPAAQPATPKDGMDQAKDLRRAALLGNAQVSPVPLPSIAPGELTRTSGNGPLPLEHPEAQKAIQTSLDFLAGPQTGALTADGGGGNRSSMDRQSLSPKSVEKDDLGFTHVRMNRTQDGLKVYGEQVITHLDKDGKVADVTGDTGPLKLAKDASAPPAVSRAQAVATAQKAFAAGEGKGLTPTTTAAELVYYKAKDGEYHKAYRVELENLNEGKKPLRMNYMVDAQSGKALTQFNTIDSIELPKKAAAEPPPVVTGTSTQPVKLKGGGTVTSKIDIGQDMPIDKLSVNLSLDHNQKKANITATVTSPSGKTATLPLQQGKHEGGTFDLSKAFAGESSKGTWTLSIKDSGAHDKGTLNKWSVSITGKATPPPPPGPGVEGTGSSLYSGTVPLSTHKNADGTWSLQDDSRGGSKTLDAQNKPDATGTVGFKDANNVWGEAKDDPRAKAAIDAHYGMEMTWDFYKNVLGRNSIDDKGEALNSYVHLDNKYNNAYWDGKQMQYGDGDGVEFSPLVSIDIAGHEISHGLTERTAGLIYEGESGGLNEAFSDIMGKGVQWYASQKNPDVKFDWAVGTSAYTPGTPGDGLRYMDDPTKDGYSIDNYKNYPKQTEVHGSSGIANNAFVLAVQGGTNKTSGQTVTGGIGMEKALKVFYRAESVYMTPNTTFAQAKAACIKAATDLYGANSQEVNTITSAWSAVGVK